MDAPARVSGIYVITCTNNGKAYVGSSVNLRGRLRCHLSDLRLGRHRSPLMQAAWNKHGEHAFIYEVLELVFEKSRLIEREQFFIDALNSAGCWGYNIAPKAGSQLGFRHSAATREKKRLAKLGKPLPLDPNAPNGFAGKKHTPDSLAKMRAAKAGKQPHASTVAAAKAANKGHNRKHSDETKAKIAARAKQRPVTAERLAILKAAGAAQRGVKWTPERIAKRLATIAAKKAAQQETTCPGLLPSLSP